MDVVDDNSWCVMLMTGLPKWRSVRGVNDNDLTTTLRQQNPTKVNDNDDDVDDEVIMRISIHASNRFHRVVASLPGLPGHRYPNDNFSLRCPYPELMSIPFRPIRFDSIHRRTDQRFIWVEAQSAIMSVDRCQLSYENGSSCEWRPSGNWSICICVGKWDIHLYRLYTTLDARNWFHWPKR